MTAKDFLRLKDGDRVMFSDGAKGTVKVHSDIDGLREIQWDDGNGCMINTDTEQGIDWLQDLKKMPGRGVRQS